MFFKNMRVLVAGGTGLIGTPLSRLLLEQGARIRVASKDNKSRAHPDAEFIQTDLTDYKNCLSVCRNMEYVFNLLCIKGTPEMAATRPLDMFEPMVLFNTNLARAAFQCGAKGYLYTSSVGVYQPAEILYEEDVWNKTYPSEKDWYSGWAKRMGEIQIEAYRKQHNWNTAIVRPSNVYGPLDNFDPKSALFMAYIIGRFAEKISPIITAGDGLQVRDYIHTDDAARGLILAAENSAGPVNLCSGRETTNREIVDILAKNSEYEPTIVYDTSKPSGDRRRVLDVSMIRSLGFEPKISLEEGIMSTLEWYKKNRDTTSQRFNVFK